MVCPWEVEAQETVVRVKGRLKGSLRYWKEVLEAPPPILDIIENGYVLPLKSEPTQFRRRNQVSTHANKASVSQSIEELLAARCVTEVLSVPHT